MPTSDSPRSPLTYIGASEPCDTQNQPLTETMPVKVEITPPLPGLSPVAGKPLVSHFDGGGLSSNDGVLELREVKPRLGIPDRPPAASMTGEAPLGGGREITSYQPKACQLIYRYHRQRESACRRSAVAAPALLE